MIFSHAGRLPDLLLRFALVCLQRQPRGLPQQAPRPPGQSLHPQGRRAHHQLHLPHSGKDLGLDKISMLHSTFSILIVFQDISEKYSLFSQSVLLFRAPCAARASCVTSGSSCAAAAAAPTPANSPATSPRSSARPRSPTARPRPSAAAQ